MVKPRQPGKDFEVEHKPKARPSRRPPPAPAAGSAYLKAVMDDVQKPVPAVEVLPSPLPMGAALEGELFPPLPESRAPRTADEFLARISELWEDAQQRFLRIGELLALAETRLNENERQALYDGLNRRFGKSARSQLMSAYRAIRDRIVPQEMAAAGWNTVYMLARLSDEQRSQAEAAGLLRPDVRQSEVRQFWKSVRTPAEPSHEVRIAELEAEERRLLAQLTKVREALAREREVYSNKR
ncbi:hypothetical protein [Azospirillum endophyticum]